MYIHFKFRLYLTYVYNMPQKNSICVQNMRKWLTFSHSASWQEQHSLVPILKLRVYSRQNLKFMHTRSSYTLLTYQILIRYLNIWWLFLVIFLLSAKFPGNWQSKTATDPVIFYRPYIARNVLHKASLLITWPKTQKKWLY